VVLCPTRELTEQEEKRKEEEKISIISWLDVLRHSLHLGPPAGRLLNFYTPGSPPPQPPPLLDPSGIPPMSCTLLPIYRSPLAPRVLLFLMYMDKKLHSKLKKSLTTATGQVKYRY
ncbi:hypothetical protein E2562_006543, partial [Oryza meyeriana var. granulata]